jgi:6-phospho-beta-glucosidase
MKLALLGGGGVRAPLFVITAIQRAERIGVTEICLMDVDNEKLALIEKLCKAIVIQVGSKVRITSTTDPEIAISGAGHIITTIRVGAEQGRVLDERIALRHGVLGQETTGPGGFAMALRSIPVILKYAELRDRLSPNAWIHNFTNPSGLVTQALYDEGFHHVVGICDGANSAQRAVARACSLDARSLRAEVFGLNHLSWTRTVRHHGEDLLSSLLKTSSFQNTTLMRIFDPWLIDHFHMFLNEYLFYYYYAEKAVASILASEKTRGEEILVLNQRLLADLRSIEAEKDPVAAIQAFNAYEHRRSSTYMYYAQSDAPTPEQADKTYAPQDHLQEGASEGYAGVALDLIEAIDHDRPLYTALNVPNQGAIDGLRPEDVVEVSCFVDGEGIHPQKIGEIPEEHHLLISSVKRYERLTVEAVRTHSRDTAIGALMAHPLVLSYSRASALTDEYLTALAPYVGIWH